LVRARRRKKKKEFVYILTLITDEARSEFFHLAHFYCGDMREYEGKYDEPPKPCPYEDDCEECPLHGFLTWLDI